MPKKTLVVEAWTNEPLVLTDEMFSVGVLESDAGCSKLNPIRSRLCPENRRKACVRDTTWDKKVKGLCQACVGSCIGRSSEEGIAKDLRKQYRVKERSGDVRRLLNRYRHEMFGKCRAVTVTIEEAEKRPSKKRSPRRGK